MDDNKLNVEYYSQLYERFGDSPLALDWGSVQSQEGRFRVLASVGNLEGARILDVGCGLAHFYDWLKRQDIRVNYTGVEMTPALAEQAALRFPDARIICADFQSFAAPPESFDFVFASGIFAHRHSGPERYLEASVEKMFGLCCRGVAFNSLSGWALERSSGEFHADPVAVLGFCRRLTCRLGFRHDYHPHDFTVFLYRRPVA